MLNWTPFFVAVFDSFFQCIFLNFLEFTGNLDRFLYIFLMHFIWLFDIDIPDCFSKKTPHWASNEAYTLWYWWIKIQNSNNTKKDALATKIF